MIHEQLWLELDKVAARYRNVRFWGVMAVGWSVAALIVLLLKLIGVVDASEWSAMGPLFGGVAVTLIIVAASVSKAVTPDHAWVARQIEAAFPDLKSGLLAAIEQRPALSDGRFGFLQESVLRETLHHAASHPWRSVVSSRRIATAVGGHLIAMSLFAFVMLNNLSWMPRTTIAELLPTDTITSPDTTNFSVVVEPGDTEIERGASLLVLARVSGEMAADATLVMTSNGGEPVNLAMSRSLDDPVFGGRVASVKEGFDYRIELGGQTSKTYHVEVFEYPKLERSDAQLVYPSYTGLEERLVQDVRSVSVVEGTQVTLICKLNKPVKSAMLIDKQRADGSEPIVLTASRGAGERGGVSTPVESPVVKNDASDDLQEPGGLRRPARLSVRELNSSVVYEATLTADKSRRLKLELIDEADRHNVEQFDFAINVVPNQPPTLKLVQPAKDLEVSPLEELDVKATAWDDFGLKRMGINFAIAGQTPVDVVLGENAAAKQKHDLANAIKFEELKAEPDQLLSYHFWAEDFGPDGNLRRTSSDMYFAEVRHFEEIFRQGQPPPGGKQQQQQQNSQAGQQAQQLAQNEKEIINATWKLIRRETSSQPTKPFAEDVEQLVQSQNALHEKATALAEKVTDEQSQAHVAAVIEAMQQAVKQLMAAHELSGTALAAGQERTTPAASAEPLKGNAAAPLQPALVAEQSAYQALLKLRAREHEVVRQQQQQSSSSQSQQAEARSQQQKQQMQQLDLKKEENRYETQRQAQSQQESAEDREARQVLNRLKELARRQHDLNERLKDLQTALQEAQTEDRQEEVKQQLKRLQDEQRQVLRDTDELQSRMETPQNQETMSNERQQLEETRDQVRRASESLEKEQVTQAAAAGTRAEKDFEELRNEFRRRASNRFNEEMRDMRESARDLEREQKDLSQRLTEKREGEAPAEPRTTEKPGSAGASPSPNMKREAKSLREDNRADEVIKGLSEQKQKLSNLTERMKQTIQEAEETEPLLTERLYDTSRNLQDSKADRALDAASRSLQRGLMEDARQVEQIAGRGISQLREGVEKAAEAVLGDETEALRRAREQLKDLSKELNREIARNSPEDASQLPRERTEQDGEKGRQGEGGQGEARDPSSQQQPGQSPDTERPSGQQPNGKQSNGKQSGEGQPQEGPQPKGQQPGQPGERQPGQAQGGQRPSGQQPGQQGQSGKQPQPGQRQSGQPKPGQRGQRGAQRMSDSNQPSGSQQPEGGTNRESAPISGEDFVNWSDRLRDVEEMVDDPELRAEAARIRDQARSLRAEMKRHSKEPNWGLVRVNVAEPLAELSNRVAEELLRRNSKQAIVPLDRDPVPPKYSEKTRRYYERLGSGQ